MTVQAAHEHEGLRTTLCYNNYVNACVCVNQRLKSCWLQNSIVKVTATEQQSKLISQ